MVSSSEFSVYKEFSFTPNSVETTLDKLLFVFSVELICYVNYLSDFCQAHPLLPPKCYGLIIHSFTKHSSFIVLLTKLLEEKVEMCFGMFSVMVLNFVSAFHLLVFSEKTGMPFRLKDPVKVEGIQFCENCCQYGNVDECLSAGNYCSQNCTRHIKDK